jgi:Flp pilus assembly protein TadG
MVKPLKYSPVGSPPRRRLRALLRDQSAATALEFALVAPPFLFMILAIFELALVNLVSVTLDSATQQAARLIRTGQAQSSAYTTTQFTKLVCDNMGWMASQCPSQLFVDAQVKSSFSANNAASPVQNGAWVGGNLKFDMGKAGDIVVVRTFYKWNLITPVLYGGLQTLPGGVSVVSAATTFRNEPYQW